jgi:hypothetical protein
MALELIAAVFVFWMLAISGRSLSYPGAAYAPGIMADLNMLAANICIYYNRRIVPTDFMAPLHRMATSVWGAVFFWQGCIEAWRLMQSILAGPT